MEGPSGRNGGLGADWPGGTRKQSRDTIKERNRERANFARNLLYFVRATYEDPGVLQVQVWGKGLGEWRKENGKAAVTKE